jgi:hypothetical protein
METIKVLMVCLVEQLERSPEENIRMHVGVHDELSAVLIDFKLKWND